MLMFCTHIYHLTNYEYWLTNLTPNWHRLFLFGYWIILCYSSISPAWRPPSIYWIGVNYKTKASETQCVSHVPYRPWWVWMQIQMCNKMGCTTPSDITVVLWCHVVIWRQVVIWHHLGVSQVPWLYDNIIVYPTSGGYMTSCVLWHQEKKKHNKYSDYGRFIWVIIPKIHKSNYYM